MIAGSLSVVVAVQMAQQNVPEIVRRLACDSHPEVDFLVCHTDADPDVPRMLANYGNVRTLPGPTGSLIPVLWRIGILAARNDTVALTTAHCIPDENWLQCLLQIDFGNLAGIGGVIENSADSDAMGWAIFMQRYLPYSPPKTAGEVDEIAADNAAYRRSEILKDRELLRSGFWEPSFHARFRAAGLSLALEPRLRVIHHNRYRAWQFFGQRFAHGIEFGLARARHVSRVKRVALIAVSPLLPLVFLRKIVTAARRHPQSRGRLAQSFPWLVFFLAAWGLGEAAGYVKSIMRR